MPGPPPKPADRRQRTNSRTDSVVVQFPPSRPVKVPPMPAKLLAVTQQSWRDFWDSPLARMIDVQTDTPAIIRLFTLRDERERALRGFKRERLIKGSLGQRVLNPLGRVMLSFDVEIRNLEDRFGLSPRSRLQLGVVFGEAAKSLAELNRTLEDDNDNETEQRDPREA